MAILSDNDRAGVWGEFMTRATALVETLGLTKHELRDAVNSTDQWIDDNAASFNSALPAAARTSLSAKQKARLFMAVAERRFNVS